MAYRLEGTDIIIDGWEQGIAASPYQGLADVSYGQMVNYPGEVSAMGPLVNVVETGATMDLPLFKATSTTAGGTVTHFYVLDARGRVFYTDATAQSWTFGAAAGSTAVATVGNSGMVYWKGYLFVFRADKPYYTSSATVASLTDWSGTVGSIVSGVTHYAFVGTDDVLYFCNGSFVGSIIQNAGTTFDPTNAATYTFNQFALAIPVSMMATCLEQLNQNLLVGTTSNQILPWDRISPTFGQPIFIGENFTSRMVTVNTNTYIFPSHPTITNGRGYIYVTNGSQVDIFAKLPDSFNDTNGAFTPEPYWTYGDAMYHRNKVFFGAVSASGTGGVWCIDLNTGVIFRANLHSTGSSALITVINPVYTGGAGTTAPLGYGYFAGAGTAGSSGDMDYTSNTLSTSAVVLSDKIPVGTFLKKKTFTQVELKLATALVSGESITVDYIDDNGTGNVGTFAFADGGVGKSFSVTFQTSQWLQIKCTLNPTNSTPSYVRLREVRLRLTE